LGNQIFSAFVAKMLRQRLVLDPKLCTNCRRCESGCPAKAIYNPVKIMIDEEKCIRCCCCQEMCPVGALSIQTPFLAKILHQLGWM
jgi:ferredoxin